MSIAVCLLIITSISASITQNSGQPQNSGRTQNVEQPQTLVQSNPSSNSGGSGGLADSPWPMFRQNLRHTGVSPYDTSGNPGKLKWDFTTGDYVLSSPTIDHEASSKKTLYQNKIKELEAEPAVKPKVEVPEAPKPSEIKTTDEFISRLNILKSALDKLKAEVK